MQGDYEVRKVTIVGKSIGITIPHKYREALGLKLGDHVKIFLEGEKLVIVKD